MARQLPCHIHNFAAIVPRQFRQEKNKIFIECKLQWKIVSEMDPILCVYTQKLHGVITIIMTDRPQQVGHDVNSITHMLQAVPRCINVYPLQINVCEQIESPIPNRVEQNHICIYIHQINDFDMKHLFENNTGRLESPDNSLIIYWMISN